MSTYEEYLERVVALGDAIVEAEHAGADARRAVSTTAERLTARHETSVARVQQQARDAATSYARSARRLQDRKVVASGVQLPARVRPVATTLDVAAAARGQNEAASEFDRAVEAWIAAASGDADAAAALAARRAALAAQRTEPAEPAPTPVEEPAPPVPIEPSPAESWFRRLIRQLLALFAAPRGASDHPAPPATRGPLDRASARGVMSGYEPAALQALPVPTGATVHGVPGAGLAGAGFSATAKQLGQRGEENFAKALAKAGLIERFQSFWSIHMLTGDTYGKQESDVDCAIVTGSTIWLIDLKYYPGGDVVYRGAGTELQCIDVPTGLPVGKPKRMTKNMQMAVERFGSRYRNYGSLGLRAAVVLVPTDGGVGRIDGVTWPGGIPAFTLPDFLDQLRREPGFVQSLDSDLVVRTFTGLLKS